MHALKGRKQTPEHVAKREASFQRNRKARGWPKGRPRSDAEKLAISLGLMKSPSVDKRRVWSTCKKCGKLFRSQNGPEQAHCSRACAFTMRSVNGLGYVTLAQLGTCKRVLEHRQVMEKMIDRPLLADETVHHKNGQRDDNRPENLELWSSRNPKGQRVEDKLAWAREILALYGRMTFPLA